MLRVVLLTATFLFAGAAKAQDRLALVVGIDRYDNVDDLMKAGNDARAVSDALVDVGFEVTALINLDERAFNRELAAFTSSIAPGDEVVFYFAGHGIEIDGRNYLLPSDAPDSPSERVIRSDSIDADEVLREVQGAGASVAVMILDACRENPYSGSGRSVGGARGLNIIAAPVGSFVLMSAASGAVAYEGDDDDPNSIFTRALLALLQEPGLALPDMARQLRRDVQRLASELGHQQRPAYYDEVAGEFFFRQGLVESEVAVDQGAVSLGDPCEAARLDWAQLGRSPSTLILEIFLDTHESCRLYSALAQEMLGGHEGPNADSPDRPQIHDEATSLAQPPDVPQEGQSTADTENVEHPEIAELRTRAEDGDVASSLELAERYRFGRGIEQSDQAAFLWFRTAAFSGSAVGMYHTARSYQGGIGIRQSGANAAFWYRRSADRGFSRAAFKLGQMFEFGDGVEQSDEEAVAWYAIAADDGNQSAMLRLQGLQQDVRQPDVLEGQRSQTMLSHTTDLSALRVLAEGGDVASSLELAERYRFGRGVEQSDQAAFLWFRTAAFSGSAVGMYHTARSYQGGVGISQSGANAAFWYRRSADRGFSRAAFKLGQMFEFGDGVEQSDEEAMEWYAIAADDGNQNAMLRLQGLQLQ
jgi:hypothetical protein